MKKCFSVLSILFCCMLFVLPVHADVIWEPDDYFYNQHALDCTYVNRMFTTNGPDGVVIVYKNPESPQVITRLDNGIKIYISYTYSDANSILWGIYEDSDKIGWLPMDYMEVVYDSISFHEDYADKIVSQSGELKNQYKNKEIYLWKYPGSEEFNIIKVEDFMPSYNSVYLDEENRCWGNINYYFGFRDVWICIDQPTDDFNTLYPSGSPQKNTMQKDNDIESENTSTAKRIVPKQNTAVVVLTIILILAVIFATAGLLLKFNRNK